MYVYIYVCIYIYIYISIFSLFLWLPGGQYPPHSSWGLYPVSSSLFVRELSPLHCSMVGFFAASFKSFLIVFFIINSGVLLTVVLAFWGRFIRLFSDLAMPLLLGVIFSVILRVLFPVPLSVVFNGLLIVD